jgi:hypothetical protein
MGNRLPRSPDPQLVRHHLSSSLWIRNRGCMWQNSNARMLPKYMPNRKRLCRKHIQYRMRNLAIVERANQICVHQMTTPSKVDERGA